MEASMAISIRSTLVAAGVAALVGGCAAAPYGYGYNDPYAYNGYPAYGSEYGPGYVEPGPSVGIGFGFYDSDHHWHDGHRDFDHDQGHHSDRDHDGHFDHGDRGDHGDHGHDDHGSGG
jgi:hypothetical protein